MVRITIKFLFIFYAIVIASSCTSSVPYPQNWPEITNEIVHDCKNFEGIYKNFNGKFYLSDLFGLEEIILHKDQKIKLSYLENKNMIVKVLDTYNEKKSFKINPNYMDYTCDDGTINIKGKPEFFIHPWIISSSSPLIKLKTAEDQSIIANIIHKSNTLAFFIVPIFSNNTEWRQWKRISE